MQLLKTVSSHSNCLATTLKNLQAMLPLVDTLPVKTLLYDLTKKVLYSCIPARSCEILWDFTGVLQESCTGFLQDSRKIPQDLARSHKILQECKKKGPFLVRSCKSIFTGLIPWWNTEHIIHTSVIVSRILSVLRFTKCMHKLMQGKDHNSNLRAVLGQVATAGGASSLEEQLMSMNLPLLSQYFL